MKTALQEIQEKMQLAFVAFVFAWFFALLAGGCAVVAYQHGSYARASGALVISLALAPVIRSQGNRFLRYGAEEERLSRQEEADG